MTGYVEAEAARKALSSAMAEAGRILQGAGAEEDEVLRASLAFTPLIKLIREAQSSGGGGVAGATGSPASLSGEVSPLPVFSDPLAEEEASKASAAEPPSNNLIELARVKAWAAKIARHDNERKPL